MSLDKTFNAATKPAPGKFIEAVEARDINMIKFLLRQGADVNQASYWGQTPLMIAITSADNTDIARVLIKAGADVSAHGKASDTPLIKAAFYGCVETVRLLIESGACLDEIDQNPYCLGTALHKASAPVCQRNVTQEITDTKAEAIIQLLLESKARTDIRDESGETPLMRAMHRGRNFEIMALLAKKTSEIDAVDNNGSTALILTMQLSLGSAEKTRMLLDRKADVTIRNHEGNTALIELAEHARYLADLDAERSKEYYFDKDERTKTTEIVCALISCGADIYEENNNGESAFGIFTAIGYPEIADKMRETKLKISHDISTSNQTGLGKAGYKIRRREP